MATLVGWVSWVLAQQLATSNPIIPSNIQTKSTANIELYVLLCRPPLMQGLFILWAYYIFYLSFSLYFPFAPNDLFRFLFIHQSTTTYYQVLLLKRQSVLWQMLSSFHLYKWAKGGGPLNFKLIPSILWRALHTFIFIFQNDGGQSN